MEPPNEWRVAPAHNMEHLQAIRKHQCTQEKKKRKEVVESKSTVIDGM